MIQPSQRRVLVTKQSASPAFTQALGLEPGDVVSVIGCGGKTSLIHRLALENRHHRVLISTTTKILPPPSHLVDWKLEPGESPRPGINLLGEERGPKLGGAPFQTLIAACPADGLALLEADGSKQLPLKGWAEHEPVIPPFTTVTIGVVSLWTVGLPCGESIVHRLPLFQALTGAVKESSITLNHIASMITHPRGMFQKAVGRQALLINQVETPDTLELAQELADLLPQTISPIVAGSVRQGKVTVL